MVKDIFRFFLIGADKQTRIPFGSPGCAVRLAATPTGLQGAPFSHNWQQVVGRDGAIYKGTTDERGVISLKVWVADPTSSQAARRAHAKWREALGRGKETCRLYVVSQESGWWWIDARLDSVSEAQHWGVPGRVGEVGETVNLTTDRSFWSRFEEIRYYNRDNYHLAHLHNYGDQPVWLRWTVTGGHDGVTIGTPDDEVALPARTSLDPGFVIDTDAAWPSIQDTLGNDLQSELPDAYWDKPLPPRPVHGFEPTPLIIRPVNPAPDFKVEVAYHPRTEAAW